MTICIILSKTHLLKSLICYLCIVARLDLTFCLFVNEDIFKKKKICLTTITATTATKKLTNLLKSQERKWQQVCCFLLIESQRISRYTYKND